MAASDRRLWNTAQVERKNIMNIRRDCSPDSSQKRIGLRTGAALSFLAALGIFLLALALTGHLWRAIAYGTVVLFAAVVTLAAYFWGAIFLGGILESLLVRKPRSAWSVPSEQFPVAPGQDIDPGLELLAAGMLVYRVAEVKPRAFFRKVPLNNARAIRPFVVARTGEPRKYTFTFVLSDENDVVRFEEQFSAAVQDQPQLIMPLYRLLLEMPRKLLGQRWLFQVRSGVTVITSLRFMFVDGRAKTGSLASALVTSGALIDDNDEEALHWHREVLPLLLDETVKRDAMVQTQEIPLEVE